TRRRPLRHALMRVAAVANRSPSRRVPGARFAHTPSRAAQRGRTTTECGSMAWPGGEHRCGFLLRDCSWSPHSFSSDAFTRPESTPALTARPFSEKAVLTRPRRLTHRLRRGHERMSAHLIGDKCGVGRR